MTTFNLILNGNDRTNIASNISWSDSIDTLGVEFTFSIAREFLNNVELGESVIFILNNKVIFTGLVVSRNISEKHIDCTCFDFAWYLNKSTVIKQFKKLKGTICIQELCKILDIKNKVEGAEAIIDCIYKDKLIIDVIRDILDKSTQITGKKFNLYMDNDTLVIEPFKKIFINGKYELSENDFINIADNIGNISYSDSVIDLKNSIIVLSSDKKAIRYLGNAKDEQSINKYGMLQEVVEVDAKDFKNSQGVANIKLKELNKVTQNINLSMLGNEEVRAGKVITLNVSNFFLIGNYLIKSSSHKLENNIHTCDVVVEVFNE